jgi:hypothetical protein
MSEVVMQEKEFAKKTRAIVKFGAADPTSGWRSGEYFQVTINPDLVSPGGKYIRFDARAGDEIHGWQRIEAMTVCEVLEEFEDEVKDKPVVMRAVV